MPARAMAMQTLMLTCMIAPFVHTFMRDFWCQEAQTVANGSTYTSQNCCR